MAKPKAIRVPRTTALFITGLARILREHLHLQITEHECWTFEQVAGWEECSARGECNYHGFSDEFVARMEQDHSDQVRFMDSWTYSCDAYNISVYLGTGKVQVAGREMNLRVRIEEVEHRVYGYLYEVRIWLRNKGGEIQKGVFGLEENGDPYPLEKSVEDQPPRKIAFWKDPASIAEEVVASIS